MQTVFLISFALTMNYFTTTESLNRDYVDIFANGIMIFYGLLAIPFIIGLSIQTYKGVWKLEVTKTSKIAMLSLFILLCLITVSVGFYIHFFFYYGFAP